jgi:hypothetical protein
MVTSTRCRSGFVSHEDVVAASGVSRLEAALVGGAGEFGRSCALSFQSIVSS